ncbi:type I restriction endonuclease subunit R [Streptomyces sp. AC1-42W]|nr:type I restriction endonuclease subunit R [Streptomyces sp. AC1-42W]PZT79178.1 type I restriction endonuclease subunit R [Streptomyces sp. AC1-42T]
MGQPEYDKTEKPLIDQLVAMGWNHVQGGAPGEPATLTSASERTSFTQVVYEHRFRDTVARLNPDPRFDDGRTWLSPAQLSHLLARIQGTAPGQGLAGRGSAGNREATDMLRNGINARTVPGWRPENPEHIRLIDWDGQFGPVAKGEEAGTARGNDLLVVSQFRVERKGAEPVTPDLVLFVNGLPWVVIECKAPLLTERDSRAALDAAVDQVIGYAGADSAAPVAEFVRYAQVIIGTDRDHAELGTVTAGPEHFAPWRTVRPRSEADVRADVGKGESTPLTPQDVLVAGVLHPDHLLTLVRDFTTWAGHGNRAGKIIGRYQQFRAVLTLSARLRDRSEAVAAERDVSQRGGVVWHTQGSGKSLTMAFLVRHLRSNPDLAGHKVVVVTDRIDLEKQIRRSLGVSEEKVHRASSVKSARKYLAVDVPDLVLITLQKARKDDMADDGSAESLGEDPEDTDEDESDEKINEARIHNLVANPHHTVVVLIDEAHRGNSHWQHARLRAMLPNAVLVGFTGTPIIDKRRKTTEKIFGAFADTYTLRDAERDGSVVPVRYEAYAVPFEVIEKAALDAKFDEKIPGDPQQRVRVLNKFARRKEILEAPSVIAAKADRILHHWATSALPDRFGAQVVAVSRLAAVRYRTALLTARDRLLERLDALDPDLAHDPLAALHTTDEERELLNLLPHRHILASLDAAVVISKGQPGKPKDPEDWKPWTTKSHQDAHIARFKDGIGDPLAAADDPSWDVDPHGTVSPGWGTAAESGEVWHETPQGEEAGRRESAPTESDDDNGEAPMAFLLVQSMLLTGFDAPVEQVLYLDRAMKGAGLLQAVARTNRPYRSKKWGQVVDFIGIGPELARSLAAYDQEHLRQVFGYDDVSVDQLDRALGAGPTEGAGTRSDDSRQAGPAREGLLLQSDMAANVLLSDLDKKICAFLGMDAVLLADETRREDLLARLADPSLRGEFDELVRDFLTAVNAVLPRPEALRYEDAVRQLGETQILARRRYLDGRDQFSPRRYGAKVRQLISQHLRVTGIEQRVPPVELTDADFMERINANHDPRARTAYMTSSLDLHITAHIASDRGRYTRFSERLDEITRRMAQDFEQAAADLGDLIRDVNAPAEEPDGAGGLAPRTEQPVYRLLCQQLDEAGATSIPEGADFYQAARGLAADIAVLVRPAQFVTLADTQDRVRKELRFQLEAHLDMDWEHTGPLANLLLELAVERREDFLGYRLDAA